MKKDIKKNISKIPSVLKKAGKDFYNGLKAFAKNLWPAMKYLVKNLKTKKGREEIYKNYIYKYLDVLSYFGILFLIPQAVKPKDDFAQFHVKQGITLFYLELLAAIFAVIPWIGFTMSFVAWLACMILSVKGMINVFNRKKSILPFFNKLQLFFKNIGIE